MTYEEVIKRYDKLIWSIVHKHSSKLNTKDDLYQECLMKLWKVFDKYNGKTKWSTFITYICNNHICNIVKSENTKKNKNYNEDGTMMKDLKFDDKKYFYLLDMLVKPNETYSNDEQDILDRSMILLEDNIHKDKIWSVLSGRTYKSVAEEYGTSYQYIQNVYNDFIKKCREE